MGSNVNNWINTNNANAINDTMSTTTNHFDYSNEADDDDNNNKKDANSVIGVFQEVLIKLYYIPILLYIEGQDDIYWWSVLGLLVLVVEDCY